MKLTDRGHVTQPNIGSDSYHVICTDFVDIERTDSWQQPAIKTVHSIHTDCTSSCTEWTLVPRTSTSPSYTLLPARLTFFTQTVELLYRCKIIHYVDNTYLVTSPMPLCTIVQERQRMASFSTYWYTISLISMVWPRLNKSWESLGTRQVDKG